VIRLAVRVAASDAEMVLAELLELAPSGVEEVALQDGRVEYAVYGPPGELPDLPDIEAAAGGSVIEVLTSEVADDWAERWKQFHRPVLIVSPVPGVVPNVYLRPPWESSATEGMKTSAAPVEIVIDPGRAFGTGAHATTRLCLELLLELEASMPGHKTLIDVGTGSGVLAIAAAKLGYEPVTAFDHDRDSVNAAAQNANVNGVTIDVQRLDLRTDAIPGPALSPSSSPLPSSSPSSESPSSPSPSSSSSSSLSPPLQLDGVPVVVVANLLRPLLLDLARALPAVPAHLLASGLLVGEVDEIANAYAETLGMHERERRQSGDWAAIWLFKQDPAEGPAAQ
jgi:ribosomal protein L11 methyltransferase